MGRKRCGEWVELPHGSGGRATVCLVEEIFRRYWNNEFLGQIEDATVLPELPAGTVPVVCADIHVVRPRFFPGGDLGRLAVFGTVNDLLVRGATPRYLTMGVLLEEGVEIAEVERIAISVANAAREAGVAVVAGDTKVVERGKGDGIYLAASGYGFASPTSIWGGKAIQPGDRVVVSGTLGDHAVAVLTARGEAGIAVEVASDCAPLGGLITAMRNSGAHIRAVRDLTRGGLAAVLHEWAETAGVGFLVDESALPVLEGVQGVCELLGLEPWGLANEGKLAAVCAAEDAERLVTAMHQHPLGKRAAIVGEVVADRERLVVLRTPFGGERLLEWAWGEPLPRIC